MKILYAFIGLVVVAGGAWFVLNLQSPEETPSMAQESPETSDMPSNEAQDFKGSMQELMARGGSWRCDVTATIQGITSSGTTYVADGMVRADFTSSVPQIGNIESHMIMRGNTAYTWSSMMNQGFKFPIRGGEVEPEVSAEMAAQVNQEYDYRCVAWPTDESVFALPTDITF